MSLTHSLPSCPNMCRHRPQKHSDHQRGIQSSSAYCWPVEGSTVVSLFCSHSVLPDSDGYWEGQGLLTVHPNKQAEMRVIGVRKAMPLNANSYQSGAAIDGCFGALASRNQSCETAFRVIAARGFCPLFVELGHSPNLANCESWFI